MTKTDYYSAKRDFYRKIEGRLKSNVKTELSFLIRDTQMNHGYGSKTLLDFLQTLKDCNDISIIDGIIIWKNDKKDT